MTNNILLINSSGRKHGSSTRQVSEKLTNLLSKQAKDTQVIRRDVAEGLPFIDEQWIGANFTPPEDRNDQHSAALEFSDKLVQEVKKADTLVIASPIYNFGIPASLKAWIDLIARARLTFKYTENGPVGLLAGKKAYVVIASGGVQIGSNVDFVSPYIKHVLGFIGITDVTIVNANAVDLENSLALTDMLLEQN